MEGAAISIADTAAGMDGILYGVVHEGCLIFLLQVLLSLFLLSY